MVGTLSFSVLAAVASFATGVVATQCTGNNFPVTILNNDLCLPKGGPKNPPGCPDEDGICPDGWYWYKNKEFCVPTTKPYINKIDCPDGYNWNPKKYQCKSKCTKNQFWYSSLEICLPKGGISAPPSPPTGTTCPNKWYWHKQLKVCVPKNPNYDPTPDCGDDDWSVPKQCCVIPPKPTCPRGTFYWPARKLCIPYNGPSNPQGPPHGHSCPKHWYWHGGKKCCAPTQPNPPNPTCPGNGHWNPKPCECENGPHPSPKPPHRRHRRADTTLCPTGTEACPITSLTGGDYECLNTKVELESCGGCASTGAGKDCTQIPNAWNVGCKQGGCEVYSCLHGYKVNSEGTGCEPMPAPL